VLGVLTRAICEFFGHEVDDEVLEPPVHLHDGVIVSDDAAQEKGQEGERQRVERERQRQRVGRERQRQRREKCR
jgi:hypothetical protein